MPISLPRRRTALAAVLASFAAVAGASPALAARGQESAFQDDDLLVFNTPQDTARTLDALRALGVERVRISLYWATVAPAPDSRARPNFIAADPGAYPPGSWDRYDRAIRMAAQRGIGVNLDVTSPAPLWATDPSTPRADIGPTFNPSASEFAQFVHAAAARYSGSYSITPGSVPVQAPAPPCSNVLQQLLGTCPPAPPPVQPQPGSPPLPRVDFWSIWNEPNQPGWLTPQWVSSPGNALLQAEAAPRIYRGLVDAAYGALTVTGHGGDTIVVGETAPKGLNVRGTTRAIKALHFIRQLYCVDDRSRPLSGTPAAARGCPTTAAASRQFAALHPGLFQASGYGHHPYELTFAPNRAPTDPDYVTIANLRRLTSALARIFSVYGQGRAGGMPLYLTEFGYNTTPPNPAGVSLAQQATYLNQAEFIAYSNPGVRTLTQFLLQDDAPRPGRNGVTFGYGATFQTGLEFRGGRPKPALTAYQVPVFVPRQRVRRGAAVRVWGGVRAARQLGTQTVAIQYRAPGGGFRTLRSAATTLGGSYFDTRVRVSRSGRLRLAWTDPRTHQPVYSRLVAVTVR